MSLIKCIALQARCATAIAARSNCHTRVKSLKVKQISVNINPGAQITAPPGVQIIQGQHAPTGGQGQSAAADLLQQQATALAAQHVQVAPANISQGQQISATIDPAAQITAPPAVQIVQSQHGPTGGQDQSAAADLLQQQATALAAQHLQVAPANIGQGQQIGATIDPGAQITAPPAVQIIQGQHPPAVRATAAVDVVQQQATALPPQHGELAAANIAQGQQMTVTIDAAGHITGTPYVAVAQGQQGRAVPVQQSQVPPGNVTQTQVIDPSGVQAHPTPVARPTDAGEIQIANNPVASKVQFFGGYSTTHDPGSNIRNVAAPQRGSASTIGSCTSFRSFQHPPLEPNK